MDKPPRGGKSKGLGLHNITYPKPWRWEAVGEGSCIKHLELPIRFGGIQIDLLDAVRGISSNAQAGREA
jgi:hypothetical protein